jgi:hypothetical protein
MLDTLPCNILLKVLYFHIQTHDFYSELMNLRCVCNKIGVHVQYYLDKIQRDPFGWMFDNKCWNGLNGLLKKLLDRKQYNNNKIITEETWWIQKVLYFILKWHCIPYPLTVSILKSTIKYHHQRNIP